MEPDFWRERWAQGRIGFHQPTPTPLLCKHWPALGIAQDARVFVPLCGKSLDLAWLAAQGQRVLGVELVPEAIDQFFAEHGIVPVVEDGPIGRRYAAGAITLIEGDVFALDDATLAGCDAVFDRAALIALPPALRRRYADTVHARLPGGCRGLLITLEYPQPQKDGPPFSVEDDEVHALFARDWRLELLERRAIPPDHPGHVGGVDRLETAVWRMTRR